MQSYEMILESSRGKKVSTTHHIPSEDPLIDVYHIHGMCSHGNKYTEVIDQLVAHNAAVHTLDLPGHGNSYGKKGDFSNLDELLDTIDVFLEKSPTPENNKKILWGNSLGGCLALLYGSQRMRHIDGIVTTATFIEFQQPSKLVYWLGAFSQKTGITIRKRRPQSMRSNHETREQVKIDESLDHNYGSARAYKVCVDAGQELLRTGILRNVPTVMFNGTNDSLVSIDAVRKLSAKWSHISMIEYPGFGHKLLRYHGDDANGMYRNPAHEVAATILSL